ncbi:hypothetical protein HKX48_008090 [Thoreauomyces humboldtii]|nr:hypothetical protein HKX48_008090 [Thoreauomyces humboldtii]
MLALRRGRNMLETGQTDAPVVPVLATKAEADALKEDLDDLVASECPLCGDLMIRSVDRPFIADTEIELVASWQL